MSIDNYGYPSCGGTGTNSNSSAFGTALNATNGTSDADSRDANLRWIAYHFIGPAIVAIGLVGNILNLIVLTRPSFKGVTYSYLIGLACSDIGVLLSSIPMMIRQLDQHPKDLQLTSVYYAHLEIPLGNMFMASSIFIVVCLTADRFAAICTVSKFKSVHTPGVAKTAIAICYLVALIVSTPLVLLKRICWNEDKDHASFEEHKSVTGTFLWQTFTIVEQLIVRFGPALILCVLNFRIIYEFRKASQRKRELKSGGDASLAQSQQYLLRGEKISKRIYKEEKRLTVLLMSIVLLFFVTIIPVAFLGIFYTDDLKSNLYFQIFRATSNNLELCNFALNFYIYILCSKEFRSKFLSFFQCLQFLKPPNTSSKPGHTTDQQFQSNPTADSSKIRRSSNLVAKDNTNIDDV